MLNRCRRLTTQCALLSMGQCAQTTKPARSISRGLDLLFSASFFASRASLIPLQYLDAFARNLGTENDNQQSQTRYSIASYQ